MRETVLLSIDDLHRRPDARERADSAVFALAESINDVGLLNPITVRRLGSGFEVIAGSHRLQACELLGWREIPSVVIEVDDLRAELAMIDENLWRAELSPVDRAKQTARRKAIYLKLHPETAQGVAGAEAKYGRATDNLSFAAETAKATGRDERTIQRDAERGEKVIDEALDMIRGTALDTGTYLDKLKRMTPNDQVSAARRDLAINRQGISARVETKPEPTYDQLRSAVLLLSEMQPPDYLRLCPPNKRAAMCQKLTHLAGVFARVVEEATT
jgi:ParB-like chromosome segregation protein Spo0J